MRLDYNKNVVYIDVETTGFQGLDILSKLNRIIQLGAIVGDREFEEYVNPGTNISHMSTKIHGITNDMVKEAQPFHVVWNNFVNTMLDPSVPVYYMVAHGGEFFDRVMIIKELKRLGAEFDNYRFQFVDTDPIFRNTITHAQSYNLGNMVREFMPDYSFEGEHTALADCRALRALTEHFKLSLVPIPRKDFKMIYELGEYKWLLKEYSGVETTTELALKFPSFVIYRWIMANVPNITEERTLMAIIRLYNMDYNSLKDHI